MRTNARLASSNCTGEINVTSEPVLAAALRAEARAAAGGATSSFNPPPSFAVSSTASAVAGASTIVTAMESPSRASFAPRTRHF